MKYFIENDDSFKWIWLNTLRGLQLFQSLELVHSHLKLTPSIMSYTFLQIFTRLSIVMYGLSYEAAQNHWLMPILMPIWFSVDLCRYSYYIVRVLKVNESSVPFKVLKWLRYSVPAILYPIGASGDVLGTILLFPVFYKDPLLSKYDAYFFAAALIFIVSTFPKMYLNLVKGRI